MCLVHEPFLSILWMTHIFWSHAITEHCNILQLKKNFKHYPIYLYHYLSGISKGQKAMDCKTCCLFTRQRNLSSQSCEFTEDYLHYTYVLVGPKSLYADVTKSTIKLRNYLFLLISWWVDPTQKYSSRWIFLNFLKTFLLALYSRNCKIFHTLLKVLVDPSFQPSHVPLDDNLLVCKYISNPLLVDGKIDVLVLPLEKTATHDGGCLVYWNWSPVLLL